MAQVRRHYRGREYDVRTMLLMLGMGDTLATLVIPYINFLPRSSDPDAAAVMKIVKAIQINLNSMGCSLVPDGFLGSETALCISKVAGKGWYDKTWVQIIGDILNAKEAGFRFPKKQGGPGLGSFGAEEEAGGLKNILLVGGVLAAGVWLTRRWA
jgi:hypothetical protein